MHKAVWDEWNANLCVLMLRYSGGGEVGMVIYLRSL